MVKKAIIQEAEDIHKLVNLFAGKKLMLPRSLNYIYEHIRDFWVKRDASKVRGCCSLNIVGWESLAEVKSLAVEEDYQNKGIGKSLVEACLNEARSLDLERVFTLTYKPGFFEKLGFKRIDKNKLPHKIWADCINCPEFPNCKEIALIRDVEERS